MSTSMSEHVASDFSCPRTGGTVTFHREYTVLFTGSGKHRGRRLAQTDCTHKNQCGVAVQQGDETTYEWARCAFLHPDAT